MPNSIITMNNSSFALSFSILVRRLRSGNVDEVDLAGIFLFCSRIRVAERLRQKEGITFK